MLFLSSRTNTKYTKYSNYNNLLSFDNKKLTVLSPELSLTYKCLLNHIKYNKLELNLENLLSQLKNFIKYYQDSKLFYVRDTFKQQIKAVNNSKYWDILVDPQLLTVAMILFSMFRTKNTDSPMPTKFKILIVGIIIGLFVYKIIKIEFEDPIKEELEHMVKLQTKLNNIKNIQELCIDDSLMLDSNRTQLLSAMLGKLNKQNKKIDLDLDLDSLYRNRFMIINPINPIIPPKTPKKKKIPEDEEKKHKNVKYDLLNAKGLKQKEWVNVPKDKFKFSCKIIDDFFIHGKKYVHVEADTQMGKTSIINCVSQLVKRNSNEFNIFRTIYY